MAAGERRRERKVVTVLFCDLVGFTSQAETLDPEDVEAILRPYHERVRAELERHGGTVEKFIGDAVMALFGAPVAHEDDPERAVRAALAIRDFALEEGLELRVGVTTGEALVSLDASPAEGEGMASGDVVNTAARLQSGAPVNGILADSTTYRATRSVIEYAEAEPVAAKGKSEPVAVWLAAEARSRFGVDVAHEARSELVGRERELGVVSDAFERARHQRTPQLLTLVGVPGIGKSRLVYELQHIVDADPELITWRQGRCLAYGDGVTLWALAEIVKAQAGIAEQDAPDEVAAKLSRAAADAVPEADASWVESHLLALVGLAEETGLGGNRRDEAFSAWRRYLEGLAEERPLVLVFEDLHWADESLLDFVDELVDWITDVPLLVVVTARPELLERRPGWSGGKLNATTLALAPLTGDETAHLLSSALGTPVLPAETQATLLERAGGNPLYAEQFAELYVERGSTDELPLPETLQGIIAARLDRLPPEEKSLVQDAAVVGKVFWPAALGRDEAATATSFLALERKGFVRRQRQSSVEGQSELAFAHALVRDVAYGQIPRADRASKHRRVAEWIESLGRPEDHAEMRGHHWRSALDLARASGANAAELVERTRIALQDAGDRAFALNSFAAAAAQYEIALELWPDDAERPELLFRSARALYLAYDDRRQQALEDALVALVAAGDGERAAETESFLAMHYWYRGQEELARGHLTRAEELAGDSVSPAAARVLAFSARTRTISRDAESGMRLANAALEMAERLRIEELRAHALTTVGLAKHNLGDPSAIADMEQALEIALAIDSPISSTIVNNLAVIAFQDGHLERAYERYSEALGLALRFGDGASARVVRANQLFLDVFRGNWDTALAEADSFIAECEAGSPHASEWSARLARGIVREGRGDSDGALSDVRRATELARERQELGALVGTLARSARSHAERGELDEAAAYVYELLPHSRKHGPHGAIHEIADLARDFGVADELRAVFVEPTGSPAAPWWRATVLALDGDYRGAAELFASMGNACQEAVMRLRAGGRLLDEGRPAEAEQEVRQALAFYTRVGAKHYVSRAQTLLRDAAQRDSA